MFALPLILNLNLNSENIFLSLMLSAQFGPFFSTFITAFIFDCKEGVKDLLRRATNIKLPWYVYVLTITVPATCMFSGVFLGASIIKTTPALLVLVPTTVVTTITSPLGEEFGWRGITLPIMQKKLSPIMASLLLGIVWAGWHYWLFLVPGQFQNNLPFILFSWLYWR
ncbi:CPBP family intramembrane glutamic endopeptidase [Tissierella sp. MB52-C2]|uniref:CPBP family intramembrane glutamic endopeptidase n=1 Tax=Tissierella sp. MB52-C2 TaxID=3070999 RepID=UPI00280A819F|nr:CPBP family intramembrane glutamic endopeptidase [Tissierella sp. MB52-C2]WMM24764.1 CPBP family intramembrane glutamic endopeptidase [Tissierella sp. MB52-C2]